MTGARGALEEVREGGSSEAVRGSRAGTATYQTLGLLGAGGALQPARLKMHNHFDEELLDDPACSARASVGSIVGIAASRSCESRIVD